MGESKSTYRVRLFRKNKTFEVGVGEEVSINGRACLNIKSVGPVCDIRFSSRNEAGFFQIQVFQLSRGGFAVCCNAGHFTQKAQVGTVQGATHGEGSGLELFVLTNFFRKCTGFDDVYSKLLGLGEKTK